MRTADLKVQTRTETGKGAAHAMRREGFIPAVLYGPGKETIMLSVSTRDFGNMLKKAGGDQLMLNLFVGSEKRLAMIKEIQQDPLSNRYVHADFYEISMDREITVTVPVHLTGTARGEEEGGLLNVVRRELEITSLPGNVPNSIDVDITDLGIGDAVHLGDITIPDGVTVSGEPEYTVVTVISPLSARAEEEEEGEEGEEGEEAEGEAGEAEEE